MNILATAVHPTASCAGIAIAPELARLRDTLPRPLVFSNGVFDLLHAGHVACLQAARAQGAALVVGVNSDASARRLKKGPGRPINREQDRASVIAALAAVSAVLVFDEDKPLALICALRPDVYVKGGDYDAARMAEAALMREWGGRTVIVPRLPALSTTALVARVRTFWPGPAAAPGTALRPVSLAAPPTATVSAWIEP